ncbi:MAG TPA: helicase-exonuclease AddAB subunit AddB [Bacillota bacterium]
MALRFILGRAGTGKTWTCLGEIKAESRRSPEGPALIFIVPEQASFQMERALWAEGGSGPGASAGGAGSLRAQVLSFRRLAWRVLSETGGAARPHLDDLGKRLVLRAILQRRRDGLEVFGRPAAQAGFVDRLAGSLKELAAYRIGPEDLRSEAENLAARGLGQSTLAGKLRDLALIGEEWRAYLKDKYTDPDDYLTLLAERLETSTTVRGASVFIDGFAGFTSQEYGVIAALLRTAARVDIALCLDPAEVDRPPQEVDLFHATRETHRRLLTLAEASGTTIEPPLVLPAAGGRGPSPSPTPTRFAGSDVLTHLEREFTRPSPRPFSAPPGAAVSLVAAGNRRTEVDAAVREIIRLCRDEGYRFRDVAVLVRDIEPYHALVSTVFADYGIPHFVDSRRSAAHHPLVELVRSTLETAISYWAPEPLFRSLKTDLVPLDRGAVDELENYVLAHGLRGRLWSEDRPWTFRRVALGPDGAAPSAAEVEELAQVNRARRAVRGLVGRFVEGIRASVTTPAPAGRLVRSLAHFLEELRVPARLAAWRDELVAAGLLEPARQHEQVWNGLVGLMERIDSALGDQAMTLAEFAGVVETGLESLRLGLIPPSLDQVLVGAVDRSRQPELRAILVLGLNDGSFPAVVAEDTVFVDQDRDDLLRGGLELGPPARLRSFHEDYLGYVALTRARERLYLSYALADEEGRPLGPSPLVNRVRLIFPGLRPTTVGLDPGDQPQKALGYLTDPGRAAGHLVRRLAAARGTRPPGPFWAQVYGVLADDEAYRRAAAPLLRSLNHGNAAGPLPPEVVRRLYGDPLRTSVTRLERFAACPFKHFLADGLRLKVREVHQVDAPDLGSLYHQALQLFVGRAMTDGIDLAAMSPEEASEAIRAVVREVAPGLRDRILLSSARYRYLGHLLERTLRRTSGVLLEHARRGRFLPAQIEVGFGPGEAWPAFRVDLGDGSAVEVRGRIDRVDLAESGRRRFLRVIDYKSGRADLRAADVYYGLSLQLLVYLAVAGQNLGGAEEPAGLMYLKVRDPLLKAPGPLPDEVRKAELLKQLRAGGMFLADPEAARLMDEKVAGGSPIVPLRLRKDGTVGKSRRAVDAARLGALIAFASRLIRSTGRSIVGGDVRVAPYRRGTERPCAYCEFRAACGFDVLLPGNAYRRLTMSDDDAWKQITAADESETPKGDRP